MASRAVARGEVENAISEDCRWLGGFAGVEQTASVSHRNRTGNGLLADEDASSIPSRDESSLRC